VHVGEVLRESAEFLALLVVGVAPIAATYAM
jgi:hypothetical protein